MRKVRLDDRVSWSLSVLASLVGLHCHVSVTRPKSAYCKLVFACRGPERDAGGLPKYTTRIL
jgi:hypothetical protein